MRKCLLLFISLIMLMPFKVMGQEYTTSIHPEIGCSLSNGFFAEAGIMRSTTGSKEGDPLSLFGYKIAAECNFIQNNFILAPKIAAEADVLFLAFRVNLIDYMNSGTDDLRFRPEAGLTLFGFITFCVGYNIPLSKITINGLNKFELSMNINFNKSYHTDLQFF